MPILYGFRGFSQMLYLSTEYSDVSFYLRLECAHDLAVGIVIEVDDGTFWKASPTRLMVDGVWCIELENRTVPLDGFRAVSLEASGPPEN